jgi:hypothetical protein
MCFKQPSVRGKSDDSPQGNGSEEFIKLGIEQRFDALYVHLSDFKLVEDIFPLHWSEFTLGIPVSAQSRSICILLADIAHLAAEVAPRIDGN